MIKIEKTEIFGWEAAIRGLRNPMNSWEKSDSYWTHIEDAETLETANYQFFVGENDLDLMKRLVKAGSDHRKFMRFITVTCDITAPRYWWPEADTYRIGKEQNSCSTMHKIHAKEFELGDFSHEHLDEYDESLEILNTVIKALNDVREIYVNGYVGKHYAIPAGVKDYWWQMIQLLPQSYNQRRTVQMNYEVLRNMYHARKAHKLDEWVDFCKWVETLPYKELICDVD